MGLPKQFWKAQPRHVAPSVRERVTRLLWQATKMRRRGANIVIYGDPGVGKSSIAALFARSFRAHRFPTTWTSVWQLREWSKEKERFGSGEISMMERLRMVDVLVIDDVTNDPLDGWFSKLDLQNLARMRNANMQPTIITTSLKEDEVHFNPVVRALSERMLEFHVVGPSLVEKFGTEFEKEFR
jgi:DNA replication protein DnaC